MRTEEEIKFHIEYLEAMLRTPPFDINEATKNSMEYGVKLLRWVLEDED